MSLRYLKPEEIRGIPEDVDVTEQVWYTRLIVTI